jgi:hypothetical protein
MEPGSKARGEIRAPGILGERAVYVGDAGHLKMGRTKKGKRGALAARSEAKRAIRADGGIGADYEGPWMVCGFGVLPAHSITSLGELQPQSWKPLAFLVQLELRPTARIQAR